MMEDNNKLNDENLVTDDPTKIDIDAEDIKDLPKRFFNFIKSTVSIKGEIEQDETMESIKTNMVMRGSTVWILICSIFVASIGLNFNSVAVIIGAMLISPLMGPIRAVGLSLATNDFKLLISGLKHFGVMIAVSLIAAWVYFFITPIKGDTSELLGRVKPQAFDILVAFFGGFAGIMASASNNKSAAMTIVPGVAIATALMPPLCTMSYGMAIGNWNYAFGAFYLFLLNSVFICLSTVLFLRALNFPKKAFIDPRTEFRVKAAIWGSIFLIVIPSVIKTIYIVRESIFVSNAEEFVNKNIKSNENYMFTAEYIYENENGESVIRIYTNGVEINDDVEEQWQYVLKQYDHLEDVKLEVKDKQSDFSQVQSLAEVKAELNLTLDNLSNITNENNALKNKLEIYENNKVNVGDLGLRMTNQFPSIRKFNFGRTVTFNANNQLDTVYTVNVAWKDSLSQYTQIESMRKLEKAIRTEIKILDPKRSHFPINVYVVDR